MSLTIHGTEGKLTGLPVGGLPNGTVTADNIADNTLTRAKCTDVGEDIEHIHYQSERMGEWSHHTANTTYLTFTIPRDTDDQGFVFMGWIPYSGEQSYRCGTYIEYNNSKFYNQTVKVAPWNNDDHDGIYGFLQVQGASTGASAHHNLRVSIGHSSRGGSSERMGAFINPDPNRTAHRARPKTTQIHFLTCDNLTYVT